LSAEGISFKPTLRARAGELFFLALALALNVASPFVEDVYLWASLAAIAVLSVLILKKKAVLVLVPLAFTAAAVYLTNPLLLVISSIISLIEVGFIIIYTNSVEYYFNDDGLIIRVELPVYSKTRNVPKSTIAEVSVESSPVGKLLGYSNVTVKLRTGEVVNVVGVPKGDAEKLVKKFVSG